MRVGGGEGEMGVGGGEGGVRGGRGRGSEGQLVTFSGI